MSANAERNAEDGPSPWHPRKPDIVGCKCRNPENDRICDLLVHVGQAITPPLFVIYFPSCFDVLLSPELEGRKASTCSLGFRKPLHTSLIYLLERLAPSALDLLRPAPY